MIIIGISKEYNKYQNDNEKIKRSLFASNIYYKLRDCYNSVDSWNIWVVYYFIC